MLSVDVSPAEYDLFEKVADEVAGSLDGDSSGHDLQHVWRVCNLALQIAEDETRRGDTTDCDREVLGAAALTHDLHRVMGEGFTHPEESLPRVRSILDAADFPEAKIPEVCHCVAVHEHYGFAYGPESDPPETVEAEILQDADNLDAMGAVGVARAFAFAGARGNPMWLPESDEGDTFGHFDAKLLRLKEDMNTETAREMAEDRHAFMETFVERFEDEWWGKR